MAMCTLMISNQKRDHFREFVVWIWILYEYNWKLSSSESSSPSIGPIMLLMKPMIIC